MVKEDKPKVESSAKPKGVCFQKSTSTLTASFKSPMTRLEYKVFNFGKQKHAAYFVKNYKVISKYIAVNYKYSGTKISMDIKKM